MYFYITQRFYAHGKQQDVSTVTMQRALLGNGEIEDGVYCNTDLDRGHVHAWGTNHCV